MSHQIPLSAVWVALDRIPSHLPSYIETHGIEAVEADLLKSIAFYVRKSQESPKPKTSVLHGEILLILDAAAKDRRDPMHPYADGRIDAAYAVVRLLEEKGIV